MEKETLSRISVDVKSATSPVVCNPIKWEESLVGARSTVAHGASHDVTDPRAPHKSNFIDATPYSYSLLELDNTKWIAVNQYRAGVGQGRPCGYHTEYIAKYDGRTIANVGPGDFIKQSFSPKEQQFIRDIADTKAKAKIRAGLVNVAMLYKERLQTLDNAKTIVGDLMRVATSIQKRDLAQWKRLRSARSKRDFARSAANRHLEIIFGWMPIFEEIEGMMEFIQQPEWKHLTGRGKMTQIKKGSPISSFPMPNNIQDKTGKFLARYDFQSSFGVRTSLRADITTELLGKLQRLGFNPLYNLYDFTPLSFVSGWFSNFNQYIQSLDPLYGATFRTGSRTTRIRHTTNLQVFPVSESGDTWERRTSGIGRGFGTLDDVVRVQLSSEPESQFELYNNFSVFSALASMSLYLQKRLKPLQRAIHVKPFRYRAKKPINLPPIRYRKPT